MIASHRKKRRKDGTAEHFQGGEKTTIVTITY